MEDLKIAYKLWFKVYRGEQRATNKLRMEFDKIWKDTMAPPEEIVYEDIPVKIAAPSFDDAVEQLKGLNNFN